MKSGSVLFPGSLRMNAVQNSRIDPWAAQACRTIAERAAPWRERTDDDLWEMMFGNTISRSWMVLSDGQCPSCGEDVRMYAWRMAALEHPWKVSCPHCRAMFPKNDFAAFLRSGLDDRGIFDPGRADRSLLFNVEHPDPSDPLHGFGVDDGEGWERDGRRWRFIGAYLVYGQWKQAVLGGIRALAEAFVVTGDRAFAHRAGVLLDRVADLYPSFDFGREGVMYEGKGLTGYVSTWHDACEETREMALAYDMVFEALRDDADLVAFLAGRAARHGLGNPKRSWADVQRNIEEGILRDALANPFKIRSNFPRTEIAVVVAKTVLDWPGNRGEVEDLVGTMVDQATAFDGLTGEKGLASYAAGVVFSLALFLEQFARIDDGFLPRVLARHPALRKTWRFYLDTRCLGRYYPQVGDSGAFAAREDKFMGMGMAREPSLAPSPWTFFWRFGALVDDPGYARELLRSNGGTVEGLPWDLLAADPARVRADVAALVARAGAVEDPGSVNKPAWRLAILRSGAGEDARAAWLCYDSGNNAEASRGEEPRRGHGHADGMNLGLFAFGLDLMPDTGYPPVQFGGWETRKALSVKRTTAHNTVAVDGRDQELGWGRCTLWADGPGLHVVRASAPELVAGRQYERTVALVDLAPRGCYLLDVFRVVAGREHALYQHGPFATLATGGLRLEPTDDHDRDLEARAFRLASRPAPGWTADWRVEDHLGYLPAGAEVHLRRTELTDGVEVLAFEAWVAPGAPHASAEAWIPTIAVRRRAAEGPLATTFVGVIEPYVGRPTIAAVRRLRLATAGGGPCGDNQVAVEVEMADGSRDLLVAADAEHPSGPTAAGPLVQEDWGLELDGDLCLARRGPDGRLRDLLASRARSVSIEGRRHACGAADFWRMED